MCVDIWAFSQGQQNHWNVWVPCKFCSTCLTSLVKLKFRRTVFAACSHH
jgi:hypothetical protein